MPKKIEIVFSKENIKEILDLFEKDVDSEEFVIDKVTRERVLANDLQPIKIFEIGGILPGSDVFIRADSDSLVKYFDEHRLENEDS